MEFTYENVRKWFDDYFEDVRKNQGDLETVPNLRRYFSSDFELTMYTAPPPARKISMSRDALLMSFVHPGLQEDIVPQCTVIDLKQKVVAVQFEIRFSDKVTGKQWDPVQASAHYHLIVDEKKDARIRRIHYWTEGLPEDIFEFWSKYRDEALAKLAINYINSALPGMKH
jgi:hypothetical protein